MGLSSESTMASTDSIGFSESMDVSSATNYFAPGKQSVMTASEVAVPILIGICGTLSNSMALFVLLSSKTSRKRIVNILVINQTVIDFLTSLAFIITYTTKAVPKTYEGPKKWLCLLVENDFCQWWLMAGSTTNLVIITFERYVMIVHPDVYRKHITRAKVVPAIVFSWTFSILLYYYFSHTYTVVLDSQCLPHIGWTNRVASQIYSASLVMVNFFIPLICFIVCYSHMLVTLMKRKQIFPSSNQLDSSAKSQKMQRIQTNVTKVMAIVSFCFIVCWAPSCTYYLLLSQRIVRSLKLGSMLYRILQYLAFCNCCVNPFIYAAKSDDFKKNLRMMMRKSEESSSSNSAPR